MIKKLASILVIILFVIFGVNGQNSEERYKQIWADYFLFYKINPKWSLYSQLGYRNLLTNENWQQLMIKQSMYYVVNKIVALHGGVLGSYTYGNEDFSIVEIRPWQGFLLKWPTIGRVDFLNFARIEERFFFFDEENRPFTFRIRFQTGARISLNNKELADKTWYLKSYFEFFNDLETGQTIPVNQVFRFNFTLGYKFNKHWIGELVYIQNRARITWDHDFEFHDDVFRVVVRNYLFRKESIKDTNDPL